MTIRFSPLVSSKILLVFLCFFLLAVELKETEAVKEQEQDKQEEESLGHRHVRAGKQRRCLADDAYACITISCSDKKKCSLYATADSEEVGTPYCNCTMEINPEFAPKYGCSTITEIPETKPSKFKDVTEETCAYQCNQVNEKNPDQDFVATFCKEVPSLGGTTIPACACTPPPQEPTTTTEASTSTTDDTIALIINLLQLIMNAIVTFVGDLVEAVKKLIESLGGLVSILKNLVPGVLQPVLNAVTGL